MDGKEWRKVAREDGDKHLNGIWSTATFAVAGGGEFRFIRLVNVGRTHQGNEGICISAWEIFGSLIE
jgi:hypothetical protein